MSKINVNISELCKRLSSHPHHFIFWIAPIQPSKLERFVVKKNKSNSFPMNVLAIVRVYASFFCVYFPARESSAIFFYASFAILALDSLCRNKFNVNHKAPSSFSPICWIFFCLTENLFLLYAFSKKRDSKHKYERRFLVFSMTKFQWLKYFFFSLAKEMKKKWDGINCGEKASWRDYQKWLCDMQKN